MTNRAVSGGITGAKVLSGIKSLLAFIDDDAHAVAYRELVARTHGRPAGDGSPVHRQSILGCQPEPLLAPAPRADDAWQLGMALQGDIPTWTKSFLVPLTQDE